MASEKDRSIRERAYALWVEGGRRHDASEQDWLRAEREVGAGPDAAGSDEASPSKGAKPSAKSKVQTVPEEPKRGKGNGAATSKTSAKKVEAKPKAKPPAQATASAKPKKRDAKSGKAT